MKTILLTLSLLSSSVLSVSLTNYRTTDCTDRAMSGCSEFPPYTCCLLGDTISEPDGWGNLPYTVRVRSPTRSVKWENLVETDIGSWFSPNMNNRNSCGRERATAIGPARRMCLSGNGMYTPPGGGKWYHLAHVDTLSTGVKEPLPHPLFKARINGQNGEIRSGQDLYFPTHWEDKMPTNKKRSVAGRVEFDPNDAECREVQYADHYHWGANDSLWVIPGSEENHKALREYELGQILKHELDDYRRGLGGVYYEHYSHYEHHTHLINDE